MYPFSNKYKKPMLTLCTSLIIRKGYQIGKDSHPLPMNKNPVHDPYLKGTVPRSQFSQCSSGPASLMQ